MGVWNRLFGKETVDIQKLAEQIEKDLTDSDFNRFFRNGNSSDGVFEVNPSDATLINYYKTNALVYACASTKANAFQQAPLVMQHKDEETGEWNETEIGEEILDPFRNNEHLSESEIKQYMSIHLDCTGKSFLWLWKNNAGQIMEAWPLPPSWVTINKVENLDPNSDKRVIDSFTITVEEGKQFVLQPEDVIYTRLIDPSNLYDGFGPAEAAARNIQSDNQSLKHQTEGIESMNLPGLVVQTKKPLNQDQRNDLRSILAQKMGNAAKDNILLLSGTDVEFDTIDSLKDYDWSSHADINESRICMAFGVPPVVVGAKVGIENSPWSNIKEAQRWFYKNTMVNLWCMVASSLTRNLIPQEARSAFRLAFDTTDVAELQTDVEQESKRARELFGDGIITRNEARGMIGFDSNDDGDVFKYQMNTVLVPADEGAGMLTSSEETIEEDDDNGMDQHDEGTGLDSEVV